MRGRPAPSTGSAGWTQVRSSFRFPGHAVLRTLWGHSPPTPSAAKVLKLAVTCQQVLVLVHLQLNATETFRSFRVDVLHVGHLGEASVHLWAEGMSLEEDQGSEGMLSLGLWVSDSSNWAWHGRSPTSPTPGASLHTFTPPRFPWTEPLWVLPQETFPLSQPSLPFQPLHSAPPEDTFLKSQHLYRNPEVRSL